jgi:hypothetical protein
MFDNVWAKVNYFLIFPAFDLINDKIINLESDS